MNDEPKNYPFECKVCDSQFDVVSEGEDVVFYCPFCGIDLGDLTSPDLDEDSEDYFAYADDDEVED